MQTRYPNRDERPRTIDTIPVEQWGAGIRPEQPDPITAGLDRLEELDKERRYNALVMGRIQGFLVGALGMELGHQLVMWLWVR